MLEQDVIQGKISNIKECLRKIEKATGLDPKKLEDSLLQDVFVLNLQRAVQSAIDIVNAIISDQGLTLPTSYKDGFEILKKEGILSESISEKMKKMAGFRNIAIHTYEALDVKILKSILKHHIGDLDDFIQQVSKNVVLAR